MYSSRASNARKASAGSRKTSANSRKNSSSSVINDIDRLYNIKNKKRDVHKLEKCADENVNEEDSDMDGACSCYNRIRKKPCWKPFKRIVFFILHFLTVLLVLLCGALVFSHIEDPAPEPAVTDRSEGAGNIARNFSDVLRNTSDLFWSSLQLRYSVDIADSGEREQFLEDVSLYIKEKKEAFEAEKHRKELEDRFFVVSKWVYFGTVACTTIGYGDISPKTDDGRFFYIFFSIMGIPLMMSLLKSCGSLITALNKKFFGFLNNCCFQGEPKVSEELLSAISILLLFLGYIAAGCLFNAAVKNWPLFTSIYFWIVTFTTVGFGDITHTFEDQKNYLFPLLVYRVFGLAMLAGVIDSILEYVDVRKVEIERKVREKKLRMSKKLKAKNRELRNSGRVKKKRSSTAPSYIANKGAMTFDARLHEPIFGNGDHYDNQTGDESDESDESSVDSAEEESESS